MNNCKLFITFFLFFVQSNSFARVYLPNEKFFTQNECEPRTMCSILKDYFLTEPAMNRDILNGYKRLMYEKKLYDDSNNFSLLFSFNSNYNSSRGNSYWTFYDGIAIENEVASSQWTNTWSLGGLWAPFNLGTGVSRKEVLSSELKSYYYLARLNVFGILSRFLELRSYDNIFGIVASARNLDLINLSIPKVQAFFKKEMYLYNKKLVSMDKVLNLYNQYNDMLNTKISIHNNIHFYNPSLYRLKNMVLNSIDAIFVEFLDYVEEHTDLKDYQVCTKKAYLEESVKKTVYNLKINFEEGVTKYQSNLNGFNFGIGGELNKPMNIQMGVGYAFTYNIFEPNNQKLAKWDYIIARKTISDDFVKKIELEEDFLKEIFILSKSSLENYLHAKENREQVYLILKGKVINRLGDKNFKFGFTTFEEKGLNLFTVLKAEMGYRTSLVNYANTLFLGLSHCALSEQIVEELQNL